ncbi:MAG: DUF1343 domain-containing protein [Hymenobacteraceae bacterium]|nr:DUF1343 domain-containing protein [Hymenobacteraceae bacterium]
MLIRLLLVTGIFAFLTQCAPARRAAQPQSSVAVPPKKASAPAAAPPRSIPSRQPTVGAARLADYLPTLAGKRVVLVVNQTSRIGRTHLFDTLRARGVNIVRVLAPEHGFRGTEDAGKAVADSVDEGSGVPVASLYGATKKPLPWHLADADIVVFDLQDVGIRFYTYLSTLHYVLEASAEQSKPVLVLDRPNPNGEYVDGPVLEADCHSFVGVDPLPIVHGLTLGEAARMMVGEGWLAGGAQPQLTVIPVADYTHATPWTVPIAPSPNLRTARAIRLYPSLCLFEGTGVSVGRGTDRPFEQIGHPAYPDTAHVFVPQPGPANAKPLLANQPCYGPNLDLAQPAPHFTLRWLLDFYRRSSAKSTFFNPFFAKLAGTNTLRRQIEAGLTEEQIRASWAPGLATYHTRRALYLLYPE